MLRLSDSCALFYILLWPICDDEGKHELDYQGLAAKLGGRWHRGKVKLFVSCLVKSGQLRLNSTSTWLQVTAWSHQKIDKPRQPDVKAADLQWLSTEDSSKALDESPPRSDRIVSDRIGSDHATLVRAPAAPENQPAQAEPEIFGAKEFIARYCELFKERYQTNPVVRGKQAGIVKRVLKDVPLTRALVYLEAFFQMPDAWLVKTKHPLDSFESKMNEITVFANTGTFTTSRQVRQADDAVSDAVLRQQIREGKL